MCRKESSAHEQMLIKPGRAFQTGEGSEKNPPTPTPPPNIPAGSFPQDNPGLCSMDKCPSVSRSESPLAGICLSESEKAAVLTLIREEVTALCPGLPLPGSSALPGSGAQRGETPQSTSRGSCVCCQQIITKEVEANEWKKKYEESRQEVLEMR